ncbi:M4 family metallopeptidase [Streptomyces sp. NBC_01497]|uniref:M4 family metallopeptidase n=1 Tax=Streptomyces sp. NBC_01497 TaxID=2903885 RepID=UPI002E30931F|nr:M4 family metallopeptidase [Streptomyces sp. NBC_01497]
MRAPLISKLAAAVAIATAASASLAGTAFAAPAQSGITRAGTTVPAASAVVAAARSAATAHAAATGIGAQNTLVATGVMVDPSGKRHVRFTQTFRGVPVIGGDIVVHLDSASKYLGVTRAATSTVSVPTVTARLTSQQARDKAAAEVAGGSAKSAKLVVRHEGNASKLAYQVQVAGAKGNLEKARTVLVDAASGAVLSSTPAADDFISPQVMAKLKAAGERATPSTGGAAAATPKLGPAATFPAPAVGSGASLFSGTVALNTTQTAASKFTLVDTTRGKTEIRDAKHSSALSSTTFNSAAVLSDTDDKWGNGATSDNVTPAVDAQYGLTSTFDFYKKTFNRLGTDDDGVGPHGVVHYSTGYANAAWVDECHCMIYGDGDGQTFTKPLVQLDVTGHELTHGVVSATAGLQTQVDPSTGNQIGEPGSLNESLADIFGSTDEFATANPNDPGNYLMGEQLGLAQGFLRRLDHPSLDKLEGTVDYWSTKAPKTEVHAGSGVSSHAFYLLAEGSGAKTINGVSYNSPTVDGSTVTGIGRDAAIKIFYQALTRYMVSTTNFHGARTATLQAAADLYGSGSTQYATVNKAWAAVNVTASN